MDPDSAAEAKDQPSVTLAMPNGIKCVLQAEAYNKFAVIRRFIEDMGSDVAEIPIERGSRAVAEALITTDWSDPQRASKIAQIYPDNPMELVRVCNYLEMDKVYYDALCSVVARRTIRSCGTNASAVYEYLKIPEGYLRIQLEEAQTE